jgi:hypothetical protein
MFSLVKRRLLRDDWRGVAEPLNEVEFGQGLTVTGKHKILLAGAEESVRWRRTGAQSNYLAPAIFFNEAPANWISDNGAYRKTHTSLAEPLPEEVNVLTVDRREEGGEVLLRLEHIFEDQEVGNILEQETVRLELNALFPGLEYEVAEEMTLGGDR